MAGAEVMVGVCEALAQRHGAKFGPAAMTVKGRERQYVAGSPEGMNSPTLMDWDRSVGESTQNSKSVVQVVGKLLTAPGHACEDLAVGLPQRIPCLLEDGSTHEHTRVDNWHG